MKTKLKTIFLTILLATYFLFTGIGCSKSDSLNLLDYGPREIHAAKDFNLQPGGENAIWMKTEGATPTTVAVLDDMNLQSFIQNNGTVVTAVIPKNYYQTEGTHQLYLLDKKTQIKSNTLEFVVKK